MVESNGLKIIVEIIKQAVGLGKTEKGAELRSCSVGLLLNLVAGYDDFDPSVNRSKNISHSIVWSEWRMDLYVIGVEVWSG